jgi:hypothetical protein
MNLPMSAVCPPSRRCVRSRTTCPSTSASPRRLVSPPVQRRVPARHSGSKKSLRFSVGRRPSVSAN